MATDRPVRRWLRRGAVALAVLLILVVAPAAAILYPTFKSYPSSDFPPATSQAEANLQDIAVLRRLPEVDRSFSDEARAGFVSAVDALEARASQLDRTAFLMGAARAVALADNGHTNLMALVAGNSFNVLPVRVGWFEDGLFVVASAPDQRDLLGAHVLSLNGQPPEQLAEALRVYVGGPANMVREISPNLLQSPELLHAAGLGDDPQAAEFQLRLSDGSEIGRTLAAAPGAPEPLTRSFWPKRYLSPVAPPTDKTPWVHVLEGAAPPPYLSRPDTYFWHDYLDGGAILYVQINRVRDQDGKSLSDYLAGVLSEAAMRQVKHAVVDLRFNPGGDYTLSADFSKQLPKLLPPDGKVFILTSGTTFSAAISTAAMLKYYAAPRGIIAGEPIGDRPQQWGEGGSTIMPNSKLAIRYTTGYHDWENGCRLSQVRTCFFLNYIYGTPSGPLLPTVPLAQGFATYAAGKDVLLDKVIELSRQGG